MSRADPIFVGWIHAFVAHGIESDAFAEIGGMVVSQKHRGIGITKRGIMSSFLPNKNRE
jgi:hypothetical protein